MRKYHPRHSLSLPLEICFFNAEGSQGCILYYIHSVQPTISPSTNLLFSQPVTTDPKMTNNALTTSCNQTSIDNTPQLRIADFRHALLITLILILLFQDTPTTLIRRATINATTLPFLLFADIITAINALPHTTSYRILITWCRSTTITCTTLSQKANAFFSSHDRRDVYIDYRKAMVAFKSTVQLGFDVVWFLGLCSHPQRWFVLGCGLVLATLPFLFRRAPGLFRRWWA